MCCRCSLTSNTLFGVYAGVIWVLCFAVYLLIDCCRLPLAFIFIEEFEVKETFQAFQRSERLGGGKLAFCGWYLAQSLTVTIGFEHFRQDSGLTQLFSFGLCWLPENTLVRGGFPANDPALTSENLQCGSVEIVNHHTVLICNPIKSIKMKQQNLYLS